MYETVDARVGIVQFLLKVLSNSIWIQFCKDVPRCIDNLTVLYSGTSWQTFAKDSTRQALWYALTRFWYVGRLLRECNWIVVQRRPETFSDVASYIVPT